MIASDSPVSKNALQGLLNSGSISESRGDNTARDNFGADSSGSITDFLGL